MKAPALESFRRTVFQPWLPVLVAGPLLLAVISLVTYHWQTQRKDYENLADQFIQRQNRVLAHDALRVSEAVADLLVRAAGDVKLLSVAATNKEQVGQFFAHLSGYNRLAVLGNKELWVAETGKPGVASLSLERCLPAQLCDRASLEQGLRLPVGKVWVGKSLRWYTPQSDAMAPDNGTLSVVYRTARAVYLLGVDFKAFQKIARIPTFPYQDREDLRQAYEAGNYIYVLDADSDLLYHPRRWHILGMDRATGRPMAPMETDADAGIKPLNFRAYREGKLRPYFDRLFARAFKGSGVDVFQATNLSGVVRVISVAPVLLPATLFEQAGPFGYVGVGCAVEHFQEPQERLVPYY